MKIEQLRKNASYLYHVKDAYFKNIRPADIENQLTEEYKILVEIAKLYFENDLQSEFAMYLMEYQYIVNLWTAHLILEYGNPDEVLKLNCIEDIERYSKGNLDTELAAQEKRWLNEYQNKDLNV